LALVRPKVVALAHTSTSYTLGLKGEQELTKSIEAQHDCRFITAFGSAAAALKHLGVKRVAFGTPYSKSTTLRGKAMLEEYGFTVSQFMMVPNVKNIYDLTAENAYQLGRMV